MERCRIEMLDVWLKGPEEKRSKYLLQLALQQLSPEEHQVIIHIHSMITTTVLHVEEFNMLFCKKMQGYIHFGYSPVLRELL